MNRKLSVWLPPDGDARLVRFQQDAAAVLGLANGAPVPPYLDLRNPGRPRGDVRLGGWIWDGEPVLEALDDEGPVGVVRFSFGSAGPSDLARLPAAPDWRWSRGVTAVLDLTDSDDDPPFFLWSWTSRRGWKSDPPKG